MDKTVIYARVSTGKQTSKNQILQLKKIAKERKWNITEIYEDHAVSGTSGREKRSALDKLLKDASRRKFNRVIMWSVDRLGRSAGKTAEFMTELDDLGIQQFYHQQGMDTSTRYGKALIQVAAVFAELEHGVITDRIMAGLERARQEGKTLGRPCISPEIERMIIETKIANPDMSGRYIAKKAGVSSGKVYNILKAEGL